MGQRFYGYFHSAKNGIKYDVYISDESYSSDLLSMDIISLHMNCPCEGEDRFNPILETSYEVTIANNTAAIDTLITDIVGATEGRFFVQIYKDSVFEWCGQLVLDIMQQNDESKPRELLLTFSDGLKRLQDIQFLNSGSLFTGSLTFIEILTAGLGLIGNNDYFDSDDYLVTAVDWWEDNMPARAENIDPLLYSRCYARLFYSGADLESKDGATVGAWSAYDVLKEVARCFGARLFLSNGRWNFIQVNEYADVSTYIRIYGKTGTQTDTDTVDFLESVDQSTIAKIATGTDFYYPPLKKVQFIVNYGDGANKYPRLSQSQRSGIMTAALNTPPAVETYQGCGLIEDTDYLYVAVRFRTESFFDLGTSGVTTLDQKITMTVKVNSTETVYYLYPSRISRNIFNVFQEVVETNDLLEKMTNAAGADGDLSIKFEYDYNESVLLGADDEVKLRYDEILVYVMDADGQVKTKLNIVAENTAATNNTYVKEYEPLRLGFGLSASNGIITSTNNLSDWYLADEWGVAAATRNTQISYILAQQILAGQKTITTIMKCEMYGDFTIRNSLSYDSKKWVFVGGRYNCETEIFSGEWFQIATSTSDITVSKDDFYKKANNDSIIASLNTKVSEFEGAFVIDNGNGTIEINYGVLTFFNAKANGETLLESEAKYVNTLDATSGNVTVTMPATTIDGLTYRFLCLNAANTPKLIPDGSGSDTINSTTEYVLSAGEGVTFVYDLTNTNWVKL
jgi:hypothetical protein